MTPWSTLHGNRRQSTAIDGNRRQSTAIDGKPVGRSELDRTDHDATRRLAFNWHLHWLLGL
jgi:hypothetical protein